MSSASLDSSTSQEKMKKMFDRADINQDQRVDFNEFLILRRRSMRHAAKDEEKGERRAARGKKNGRRPRGGERSDSLRSDIQPQTPVWVEAVREEQRKGDERYAAARQEHDKMVARRFAHEDGLADLSADELLLFEAEVLVEFPTQLSASAIQASLSTLGLRVGKLFAQTEIDRLAATLVPTGRQGVAPAALLAALSKIRSSS